MSFLTFFNLICSLSPSFFREFSGIWQFQDLEPPNPVQKNRWQLREAKNWWCSTLSMSLYALFHWKALRWTLIISDIVMYIYILITIQSWMMGCMAIMDAMIAMILARCQNLVACCWFHFRHVPWFFILEWSKIGETNAITGHKKNHLALWYWVEYHGSKNLLFFFHSLASCEYSNLLEYHNV